MRKEKLFLYLGVIFYGVSVLAETEVQPPAPAPSAETQEGLQQRMYMLGQLLSQGGKQDQQKAAQQMQQVQQVEQLQTANASQQQIPPPQPQQALPPMPPPPQPAPGQTSGGANAAVSPPIAQTRSDLPSGQLPASVVAQYQNPPPAQGNLYDDAFSGVVNQMLPMTPEQITRLRGLFNETQRAAVATPGVPAKPVTNSVLVNLSPQAAPPIVRLGAGFISSVVFIDSTGQPWPIEAYSIGDPIAFNIQWDKKSNDLLIQSLSFYKRSNLAVILKGLNTPVMLTLISGQEAIDYRVDLRIPGMGPNAFFLQSGLPDVANPILLDVLNGIPPKGSKTLTVSGGDCQAWLLKDKLYLRTRLDVISPAWKAIMSSVDGTHAYELQPSPVVLTLQHGKDKTLTLTLEGFD